MIGVARGNSGFLSAGPLLTAHLGASFTTDSEWASAPTLHTPFEAVHRQRLQANIDRIAALGRRHAEVYMFESEAMRASTWEKGSDVVHPNARYKPALPGRHVGEVADPQLVGPLCPELPVHSVQRAPSPCGAFQVVMRPGPGMKLRAASSALMRHSIKCPFVRTSSCVNDSGSPAAMRICSATRLLISIQS